MKKRILSALLAISMIFSIIPSTMLTASAANGNNAEISDV